jgi:chromosomal replication initiation ATPase DnaA
LQLQLTSTTFNTWLARSAPVLVEDGTLVVGLHNKHAREWIENRLHSMIQRTLASVVGRDLDVKFIVSNEEAKA